MQPKSAGFRHTKLIFSQHRVLDLTFQAAPKPQTKSPFLWLEIAIALTLWAAAFPAIRVALHSYSPAHLALGRYLVASLTLLVLALFNRLQIPAKADWWRIGAAGFCGFSLYNVALNSGEMHVPAGTASFLVNTAPIWTLLVLTIFGRQRVGWRGWIGVFVSLSGVGIIAFARGDWRPDSLFLHGALLILLAAFGTSFYVLLQKELLSRYAPLALTTWMIWAGTLWMLPFGFLPFGSGLVQEARRASFNANFALVYMGVFSGALAYALWARVLSQMEVSRAITFIYLIPILATAISWVWLGETLNLAGFCGGLVTLGGVVLVNTARRKK